MPAALLVGNDINNLSTGYDWAQLLTDLVSFVGAEAQIEVLREQFPLFYEEICIHAIRRKTKSEAQIKQFIADKVAEIVPNDCHQQLLDLQIGEILTTNYEFALERAASASTEGKDSIKPANGANPMENKSAVAERRYSIFRNYKANGIRFWHIHGDCNHPNSIALGYEHYSGYLQTMRNYVVSGTGKSYKKVKLRPLTKRIRASRRPEIRSWLDVFFTHDVHIVGLGLDFVEIHLWWLLTFRARAQNSGKLLAQNKVFYYYPKQREQVDKTKLRFLSANSVRLVACDHPNGKKLDYYQAVLREMKAELGL